MAAIRNPGIQLRKVCCCFLARSPPPIYFFP
jgi:hypothetical protein